MNVRVLFGLFCSLASFVLFSQTAEISAKSHHSSVVSDEVDNFGLPPMQIDTIIFLNDSVLVEVSSHGFGRSYYDTVVNHPYLMGKKPEEIRSYFPVNTVFIGLEKSQKSRKNNLWIVAILLLGFGIFYVRQGKVIHA
jgi:hypothetical protein